MGQQEVYKLLKGLRSRGDDRYYTFKEIQDALSNQGAVTSQRATNIAVRKLRKLGAIEKTDVLQRYWVIGFRAKKGF